MADFIGEPLLPSLLTAVGIGLLIGLVRERQHMEPFAGVRTHALTALATALAAGLGVWPLLAVLALVVLLLALAYRRTSTHDPGLTGEVALMLSALLGALSVSKPALAAAIAVVVACLLYAKNPLHRFSRELLSEREVHDGIILLSSALVILPMLPDHPIDSYGVLNPAGLWRLVVLVMGVGALAHVALRLFGQRWGLPLAGFLAGYVSSTAATLDFATRARAAPDLRAPLLSASLLANAASLSLFVPILATAAPDYLGAVRMPLASAILVLLVLAAAGLSRATADADNAVLAQKRMFSLRHAIALAAVIAVVLYLGALLNAVLGPDWALWLALLAASVELHAALIGVAGLSAQGAVQSPAWALVGLLAISALAKSAIAAYAGNAAFAARFASAMALMLLAAAGAALLSA